jgi:uncharacterized coiled-coil DUF342 family protein
MIWIILSLLLVFYIYDYYKRKPYKIIDFNERKAYEHKIEFLDFLEKEIEMRAKQLREKAKQEKIKVLEPKNIKHDIKNNINKLMNQINIYHAELKKNKKTMDLFQHMQELHFYNNSVIPNFDRYYLRLKTRYKHNLEKLVEISDDYREWYYYQTRLFDPVNYELWNENSYDDQEEAKVVIAEINEKFGFDMKPQDALGL